MGCERQAGGSARTGVQGQHRRHSILAGIGSGEAAAGGRSGGARDGPGSDVARLCTEWDVFRKLDWDRAGKVMARKLVIDGRNLYSPQSMRDKGFEYFSFGRE